MFCISFDTLDSGLNQSASCHIQIPVSIHCVTGCRTFQAVSVENNVFTVGATSALAHRVVGIMLVASCADQRPVSKAPFVNLVTPAVPDSCNGADHKLDIPWNIVPSHFDSIASNPISGTLASVESGLSK